MPGHLILVVHGIGEQKPGETVDSVLAGAIAEQERFNDAAQASPAAVDVQTEIVEIPQEPFGPETPQEMPHFPLHLRRVRKAGQPSDTPTTLADVFWADISPAPRTQFQTLLELIRTVLATSYLAMENAKSLGSRSSFWMVLVFAWLFFAGIAAVNTLLFLGVLILVPVQMFGELAPLGTFTFTGTPGPEQLTALNGLLAIAFGLWIELRGAKTQLQAQFARGLLGCGVIVMGYVAWTFWDDAVLTMALALGAYTALASFCVLRFGNRNAWLGWMLLAIGAVLLSYAGFAAATAFAPEAAPDDFTTVFAENSAETQYFVDYISTAISLMSMIWFAALLLCLAIYLTSWWERLHDQHDRPKDEPIDQFQRNRRIYPPICSALILFWMVLASSFWVFVEFTVRSTIGSEKGQPTLLETLFEAEMAEALGGMTIAVLWFFVLVFVAAIVAIRRAQLKEVVHRGPYHQARRLLLNIWFQRVFALSSLAIGFVVLHLIATGVAVDVFGHTNGRYWPPPISVLGQAVTAWLSEFEELASLFLLVLAFAVYNLFEPVGKALGVIRDITGYATTHRMEYWAKDRPNNFRRRDAIEARFQRVLELSLKAALPDRLTVISHSLGTVVATRVLGRMADANGADDLPSATQLVTMGSPVTHIYRKYFPGNFEVSPVLLSDRIGWTNIYRRDDFVGTRIDGIDREVRNFDVPAAGHPGYFTDKYVWRILGEEANIRLL